MLRSIKARRIPTWTLVTLRRMLHVPVDIEVSGIMRSHD